MEIKALNTLLKILTVIFVFVAYKVLVDLTMPVVTRKGRKTEEDVYKKMKATAKEQLRAQKLNIRYKKIYSKIKFIPIFNVEDYREKFIKAVDRINIESHGVKLTIEELIVKDFYKVLITLVVGLLLILLKPILYLVVIMVAIVIPKDKIKKIIMAYDDSNEEIKLGLIRWYEFLYYKYKQPGTPPALYKLILEYQPLTTGYFAKFLEDLYEVTKVSEIMGLIEIKRLYPIREVIDLSNNLITRIKGTHNEDALYSLQESFRRESRKKYKEILEKRDKLGKKLEFTLMTLFMLALCIHLIGQLASAGVMNLIPK